MSFSFEGSAEVSIIAKLLYVAVGAGSFLA